MTTIVPPRERECERCGRTDVWDDDAGTWRVVTDDDGDRLAGDPFCLHEWDINGTYNPLEKGA
ncbi:HEWD family protein [Halosimplex sp. J119]